MPTGGCSSITGTTLIPSLQLSLTPSTRACTASDSRMADFPTWRISLAPKTRPLRSHCENSTLGVSGRKKRLRLPATFTKCGGRLRAPPILSARLLKALLRRTCREAPQQHQRPVRRPSHRNVGITGLPCAVEVCPHGTRPDRDRTCAP